MVGRVIRFLTFEGPVGVLYVAALAWWIYRLRAGMRPAALALAAAALALSALVAKRLVVHERRELSGSLTTRLIVGVAVATLAARVTGQHRIGDLVLIGGFAAYLGCRFWALSDPAFALVEWLRHPQEMGSAPDEIHLIERRTMRWGEAGGAIPTALYRYRYGSRWDYALTGPFVLSFKRFDLGQRTADELFAEFVAWFEGEPARRDVAAWARGASGEDREPDEVRRVDSRWQEWPGHEGEVRAHLFDVRVGTRRWICLGGPATHGFEHTADRPVDDEYEAFKDWHADAMAGTIMREAMAAVERRSG